MALKVRPCTIQEAQAVLELWQRAEATPSVTDTLDDVEYLIRAHPGALLIAVEGDEVVGSVIGASDGWRGNIYRLVVDPRCRRQGVGRELVETAEHTLKAQGLKRVTALVETDHPDAVAFWDAIDYTLRPNLVRYYRDLA